MRKVIVLATGGTIASRVDRGSGHATAVATGEELLGMIRARGFRLPDDVEVGVEQFCNLGSFRFDLELAFRLARRVDAILAAPGVAGVVVTQGTDTMEESAWLADLVVGSDKPVVFTGAQRHADEPDSDGPRNLADAIKVAAAPAAQGLGAVVVFESELHAARDVAKLHTLRVGTFWSGEHGKLGEVDGEAVILHRRPLARHRFAPKAIEPRIDLIRLAMGCDGRFIRCAVNTGARGIVIEAFGRGNANHEVVAGIRDATGKGIPVVVASRCAEGRVRAIYGDGGGGDVAAAGGIFAGDLGGLKARVLLAVLLGPPATPDLARIVAEVGG